MKVRAVRGAITIENNTKEEILLYTGQLLSMIIDVNKININDIISIIFTVTKDIDAEFPAVAARDAGLDDIPLMCAQEINVANSLQKCIRIMLHINTDKALNEIVHVYLRDAEKLRPDLKHKNRE